MNDDAPEVPCPHCGSACERLTVDVWQCQECGHIWTWQQISENDAGEKHEKFKR